MREDESPVAIGGAFFRRAGCLLVPFIPVRAAGALIVTTRRVVFEPVLHYKLVARRLSIDLGDVSEACSSGSSVEFSLMDLVRVGKALTVRLKSGMAYTFRSVEADQLADAINQAIRRIKE